MKWARVVGMKLKPYNCIACGCTPTNEEDPNGGPADAYFAEGVDVNWGDSVYLCGTCVRILGELRGMVDTDKVEKVQAENKKLKKLLESEEAKHEALKEKVSRMVDGAKAKREAKAAVSV